MKLNSIHHPNNNNPRMNRCGRLVALLGCLFLSICLLLFSARPLLPDKVVSKLPQMPDMPSIPHPRPWQEQSHPPSDLEAVCVGPRGGRMDNALTEDLPQPVHDLRTEGYVEEGGYEFPVPTYGSYDEIGLGKSWMTFDQRYGPYGYRQEDADYNFTRVDWERVNWGRLQDQCLLSNPERTQGREFLQTAAAPRFRLVNEATEEKTPAPTNTGRHAIVLRAWETFNYAPEDFWNIRSIITEASLATQGEYTVFLLVDVKREGGKRIHEDDDYYRQVLEESVPEEFRDIAVLFHKSLQKSWYAKVDEYTPFYQIMQPLQLFAHFYRDFDTYWQVEMDTRFTGHVGEMARAFSRFGKEQPYKQSRERSSWSFIPKIHGSYEEFSAGVNKSLKGGAGVWGPIDNGVWGWKPVGPKPPVKDPKDENFEYGVGDIADLLLFSPISDVLRIQTSKDWPFVGWHRGVEDDIPRFLSFPAQAWASRSLLEAVHSDQHELGLRVHSEATLPTFALWHGFKVVQVPMPKFQFPERDLEELNLIFNGGKPTKFSDGIANGPAPYRAGAIKFFSRPRTFEWQSSLNNPVWEHWMGDYEEVEEEGYDEDMQRRDGRLVERARSNQGPVPDDLPGFMRMVEGRVYAPPFMMHPRKTNSNHGAVLE